MQNLHRISKTDLARKTHQILRDIQRGQMAIIESHGQAEAAMMDIIDYRILRAAAAYAATLATPGTKHQVAEQVQAFTDEQELYNQVLRAYFAEGISLGRAAELLDLPAIDLRFRFARLELPLRLGPATLDELTEEVEQADTWGQKAKR